MPPYVVYKVENMWSTWTENWSGRPRVTAQKIDGLMLHVLRTGSKQVPCLVLGTKIGQKLSGNNLSSHICVHALKLCEEHDVRFVCLAPNSTHLTQLLDVTFFARMKRSWRGILSKWKESASGSKFASILKDSFPTLVKFGRKTRREFDSWVCKVWNLSLEQGKTSQIIR